MYGTQNYLSDNVAIISLKISVLSKVAATSGTSD